VIDAFSAQDIDLFERFARLLTEGFPRFVDIVEHNRLEEQLRQSQKMEAIGQMIAGVSHNFNNMLTMVLGNLELARQHAEGDLLEYVDEAADASRAADLIRELMQFSRRDEKDMERSDVASVVSDAVHFCQRTLDGRIQLRLARAQRLPPVLGNRSLLQQIVVNLCLNARDAVEATYIASPRIDVELDDVPVSGTIVPAHVLDPPARCVRLRVRDNGIGMDDITRQRVFEHFFTTKGVGEGTGLGLTTVYGIVRDHGGWIDVQSRIGKGTQFTVFLPSVEGEAADRSPAPADARAGVARSFFSWRTRRASAASRGKCWNELGIVWSMFLTAGRRCNRCATWARRFRWSCSICRCRSCRAVKSCSTWRDWHPSSMSSSSPVRRPVRSSSRASPE
jgi:signal transduction histidine kinase